MRSRALAVAALVAFASCGERGEPTQKAPPPPSAPPPPAVTAGPDPWKTPSAPSLADTVCPKVLAPYFYQIEKNGKVSHMLGTRHIGVALYKMPPIVLERLKASTVYVSEVASDDPTRGPIIPQRVVPLPEQLGPELWQRYRVLAGDKVADAVVSEKPAMAILRASVRYEDLASALDNELELIAREQGMKRLGLETASFQQQLLDRWLDIRMLRAYIEHTENVDEIRTETIEDVGNYCKGIDDTPGIDGKQRADMIEAGYTEAELATFDKELLSDRNHNWIPTLVPILAEGDAFIAVGADHLRGELGVPALLRAEGYKVVRVTPPN